MDEHESEGDEVFATLIRSPIDARCWVPFLPDTEVMDSVWAGGIRAVKKAAMQRVQTYTAGWLDVQLTWRRLDADTWELVPHT